MTERALLTTDQLREIDAICDRFEAERVNGSTPSISAYVSAANEAIQDCLRQELLALQSQWAPQRERTPVEEDNEARRTGEPTILFRPVQHTSALGNVEFPGFVLLEEIAPGIGGMGMVFKARDENLNRIVALKCAKAHLRDVDGRDFFTQEARHAASLDHAQIVKVYNFVAHHDPPFYVMQFVNGLPLDQAAAGRTPDQIAGLLEQAASVLDFAHNHGVIHRDIKPSNLLVANSGRVYIADFGLAARWNAESLVHSPDASVLGTMHYIPPEVYAQAGRVCPAIDVYALGVTMYRLLTGKHPFAGATFSELQRAVLHDTVPLLKDVNPAVPEPLQRICLKAMERDPAERYQSAQQMADDLRRFLAHREVLARPTRYTTELEGLLQNHSTEIRSWQEKNLINITDMDRLLLSYRMLMTSDSPWRVLSREFPWESILMRLGGWFILLSSVLWLVFYWKDLDRAERIVSVAFPAVVLNGIGWLLQFLGSKWNARIFLSTGALLLPLLTIVCLTEYELAAASNYHSSLEERRSVELLDTGENVPFVTPSNIQLTLAFAAFVAYCSYLVKTTDARVFVLWLGLGLYLFATSALLVLGLKDWVFTDGRATTLSCYIVIAGAVGLLAMCLRAENAPHRAAVLFGFFPIPLAASLSALAHFGVQEWFKELTKTDQLDLASFWCMSNGLVYLGLASYCSRSTEGFVRFWGGFFILLVPLTVLIPCHLMFDRGELLNLKAVPESVEELLVIGDAAVTSYALLLGGFSVTFMAIGTWRALPAVTAPGVVGLGMFVMRFTERHFQDHVWWPTFLAIAGSAALLSGLLSSQIRSRKERNGSG